MSVGADLLDAASGSPAVRSIAEKSAASLRTQTSYEKNRHKPCAKCSEPRHISKKGNCHTTLCDMHYKLEQEHHRMEREKRGST